MDKYQDEAISRLAAIESRLADLAGAAVLVARVEERYKALETRHDELVSRFEKLEQKVDTLESTVQENTRVIMNISKLFWIIIVALSAAVATQYFA